MPRPSSATSIAELAAAAPSATRTVTTRAPACLATFVTSSRTSATTSSSWWPPAAGSTSTRAANPPRRRARSTTARDRRPQAAVLEGGRVQVGDRVAQQAQALVEPLRRPARPAPVAGDASSMSWPAAIRTCSVSSCRRWERRRRSASAAASESFEQAPPGLLGGRRRALMRRRPALRPALAAPAHSSAAA